MIGGIDVPLRTMAGDSSSEVAVRAIRQEWPLAVFENGLTGERYNNFWQIPFDEIEEIFVYRDSACADVWDAEGAIPAVRNTMIHIVSDDGLITVVVDERDRAMNEIIGAISSALSDDILCMAEMEAA